MFCDKCATLCAVGRNVISYIVYYQSLKMALDIRVETFEYDVYYDM